MRGKYSWLIAPVLALSSVPAFAQDADTNEPMSGSASVDASVDENSRLVEPRDRDVEFNIFGVGMWFDDDHELYDHKSDLAQQSPFKKIPIGLGLRGTFLFTPYIGIEGEVAILDAETDEGDSAQILNFNQQLLVQYPAKVTPFIFGGVGGQAVFSDDGALGNNLDEAAFGGGGLKLYVGNVIVFRLDGRVIAGPEAFTDDATVHYGVTFGVGGSFDIDDPPPAPPADDDRDGIPNDRDECPNEIGVAPTGCPQDPDGDGLIGAADRCPEEPETVNNYQDDDGCPDEIPDTDQDTINDVADKCPESPEDLDGFEDEDGCPDPDNDNDGVNDDADACPAEAGVIENRGCPDADRDNDGVVDRLDNCPDEPGTAENRGCKKKQLVTLTQTRIEILDRVYFVTNRARIQRRSNALLNNIADVMRAHPEIEKVRIEGHTDDRGKDDYNMELSQKRSEAVAEYLIKRGVDRSRLEAVGMGETEPVASNETNEGRAANRRVEFEIVGQAPPTPTGTEAPATQPTNEEAGQTP